MNDHPDWLPDALQYSDFNGDWDRFLDEVYKIFECDFKKSRPLYMNLPMSLLHKPLHTLNGMVR